MKLLYHDANIFFFFFKGLGNKFQVCIVPGRGLIKKLRRMGGRDNLIWILIKMNLVILIKRIMIK